jgi:ubiquinone/menaquinone biosynthesis C-methylase UbiE
MRSYRAIPHFYDDEHAHVGFLQQDIGFLIKHLPRRTSDVLMLACGTGRGAIPVAQAGHRVVGVDIDERMLAIAERKRDFVGLSDRQLSFEKQDLLKLDLGRKFDVAAIVFNSFLMFTKLAEQDEVLKRIARLLKPRGRLWIDVFNPDLARIAEPRVDNADIHFFYSHALDAGVQQLTHIRSTSRPQVRQTTFEYVWFKPDGTRQTARVAFELTYFFPRELQMLVERNGFVVEGLWGDYDASAVTPDSPRLVLSARKAT